MKQLELKMIGMNLGMLLVFLIRLPKTITIAPGCGNCGCRVDDLCARTYVRGSLNSYWMDDYCTNGCNPGFGGNRCYNTCPVDCVTCEHTESYYCASCKVGKYLNISKRCVDCPATCTICSSRTDCQECISSYYNQGDTKDCSLSCPGNCMCSSSGVCSVCQDGYFNVNEECRNACPSECKSCSSLSICQVCNDGYFNGRDNVRNNEVTNCSLHCRDTCVDCTSYNACTFCEQGHYGSYCQNNCSVGCKNNECHIIDGSCVCKDGFKGSNCNECVAGRHGELCEKQCPDTCKDIICIRDTGYCVDCKSINISGDTCDRCVNGTWDAYCSSACPTHCDGPCLRLSGHCKLCKGNFRGDQCNDCTSGFHGVKCDEVCPKQCHDSFCYRSNGTCKQCNDNYAGPTCEDCVAGMHGQTCGVPCLSETCSDNTCDWYTGNCISCPNELYGLHCDLSCSSGCNDVSCDFESGACECMEHYTGDKCCNEGGRCRHCSSNTVCETCDYGYYGEKCDNTCPTTCAIDGQELQCEKVYGKCLSCTDGFHGDDCNKTCSETCFNSLCVRDNGHCIKGCVGEFEGPTCSQALTNIAPAVGGGTASVVVITAIIIMVIVVIRRRRSHANRREDYLDNKQKGAQQLPGPSPKRIDNTQVCLNDEPKSAELEEDIIEDDKEDIVIHIPERREAVYENVTRATVSGLEAYVRKKTEQDYKHEFAVF